MKVGSILYTPTFLKHLKKIPKRETLEIAKREKLFRDNLFHPKLKTHKLKGKLANYYSLSISDSYRIVFRLLDNGKVLFLDVGTHEIYR